MISNIIDERLRMYAPHTIEDEEHALKEILQEKIRHIDWNKAANDVASFLNFQDRKSLNLWSVNFFMDKLNKLENL